MTQSVTAERRDSVTSVTPHNNKYWVLNIENCFYMYNKYFTVGSEVSSFR